MQLDKINAAIATHASLRGNNTALRGANYQLSYAELQAEIQAQQRMWHGLIEDGLIESGLIQDELNQQPTIALALDNHPAWVVIDLAALASNMPLIPLPLFFSSAQWLHAIADAGANIVITDQPELFEPLLKDSVASQTQWIVAGKTLTQFILRSPAKATLPRHTAKITYTSGSTGTPKGVCLSADNMINVASSIADATQLTADDIHLSVLPLATLLENVAGVYAPLLAGACCVLLPSSEIGLTRATGLDMQKLLQALTQAQASTAIFTPELLHALVKRIEDGDQLPCSLRFLAVGGASVSPALLERAQQAAIPVYEGYGLSECASVVALNTPALNKVGTVGKVLPHLSLSFTDEHEVVITGNAYLGYVGQASAQLPQVYTGDIGHLDADGYLVISGRKKNIFITSFGRNVSPEWVERELTTAPGIAQAALFGEAKPWNTAIIVPSKNSTAEQIKATIQSINHRLPDYARVTQWLPADEPFTLNNQQLTANGRNRRDVIWQHYRQQINSLYER